MKKFDLIIRGGMIVDGARKPAFRGDIAIENGRIAAIGPDLDGASAEQTIDAHGLIVAPGAIDLHAHFDAQVHWDPYCTPHSWHGMTTTLITSCGFGYAPVRPEMRERTMAMMESTEQVPLAAQRAALPWTWETYPEWLEHLKATPKAINMLNFIPLNQMLIYVLGIEGAKSRNATAEEMAQLKAMLNEAMGLGAAGFSFSRMLNTSNHTDFDGTPMPTDVRPPEDFYELAAELGRRKAGIIQITANVPGTDESEVVEKVARASGRPVIHLVAGPYSSEPDHHRRIMAWLDRMAEEGLHVYSAMVAPNGWMEFKIHEFNFWERISYFQQFVNADFDRKLELCFDPEFLAGARDAYDPVILGGSGGKWDDYQIVRANTPAYDEFDGKSVGELAKARGLSITDAMFDLLGQSKLETEFTSPASGTPDPALYAEVFNHPRIFPNCSDGGAHIQTVNVIGTSEYLRWAVRDEKILSLEEMHYKASGLGAEILGLKDRGTLRVGNAADIMIYDLATLDYDRKYLILDDVPGGLYRRAAPPPRGMKWVIVNGEPVLENGKPIGPLPGRVIPPGPEGSWPIAA